MGGQKIRPYSLEFGRRVYPTARRVLRAAAMCVAALLVIGVGESIPLLKEWEARFEADARWRWAAGIALGTGFVLFMGAILWMLLREKTGADKFTFTELWEAFRSRAWRREARWRRRLIVMAGALLMSFGIAAVIATTSPAGVMLLVGCAGAYAAARLSWALWKSAG